MKITSIKQFEKLSWNKKMEWLQSLPTTKMNVYMWDTYTLEEIGKWDKQFLYETMAKVLEGKANIEDIDENTQRFVFSYRTMDIPEELLKGGQRFELQWGMARIWLHDKPIGHVQCKITPFWNKPERDMNPFWYEPLEKAEREAQALLDEKKGE